MKKAMLILVVIAVLGAIGANPRYLEELRLGGGFGDTKDGGADFEKDGTIRTDGTVLPAAVDLPDGTETLLFGTDDDIRVGYDEVGEDRLEWGDGVNLLMSLSDTGTAGDLQVTGGLRSALGLDTLATGTWTLGSTTPSTVRFDAASGGSFDWRTNAVSRMELTETQLHPATDKALTLGSASTRWGTIWGDTGEFSGDLNLTNSTGPTITATAAGQNLVLTTASGDIFLDDNVSIGSSSALAKLHIFVATNQEVIRTGNFGGIGTQGGGYTVLNSNAVSNGAPNEFETTIGNANTGMGVLSPMRSPSSVAKGGVYVRLGDASVGAAFDWSTFTAALEWDTSGNVTAGADFTVVGDIDLPNATDPTITASATNQNLVLTTASGQVIIDDDLKINDHIHLEETETVDDGSPDISSVNFLVFDPTTDLTVTNFDGLTHGGEVLRVVNIDAVNTVTFTQTANIRVLGGTTLVLGQFEGATFVKVTIDSVFTWCQVG